MTYTAGMSQKVRANGLKSALGSAGQSADGLEILLSGPASGEGRQSNVDNLCRGHFSQSVAVWASTEAEK